MKLTDIKKRADAKAADVEAARKHAQLMAELDVHPLLKWGCARDVRDAYFCGVVFAAVSDDDNEVDKLERKAIDRIGRSLGLSENEVGEVVETVTETVRVAIAGSGVDVFAMLEEAAAALKDVKVFRLFVAEYMKVCGEKEVIGSEDVENQLTNYVCAPAGLGFNPRLFDVVGRCLAAANEIKDEDLLALADGLGDDAVRYLMLDLVGDVAKRLKSARRSLVAKAGKDKARLERVRKAFEKELRKIGETYKEAASMPVDWENDIRERMTTYVSADVDWVKSMNNKLASLNRIPLCSSGCVNLNVMRMRRKLVGKLVGMLWVAEKEIDTDLINKLLSSARQLSAEGFRAKIEAFISGAFKGVVELCRE